MKRYSVFQFRLGGSETVRKEIVIHGDQFTVCATFGKFHFHFRWLFFIRFITSYGAMIWNLIQLDAFNRIQILVKHIFMTRLRLALFVRNIFDGGCGDGGG